ncbi:MAG: MFS transporter [Deltaproteobacteria bacterium]|nr:MAG: MFS transporter [Deltaproteobacteria bacterium]
MIDKNLKQQIQRTRGKFIAMTATYTLGVFNDSFFRQSAMLLAVACNIWQLQGWIIAIFTLPYIIFASTAGWLADRFAKRFVVIGAKILELAAMICGAVGIITINWRLIMPMVFVMGFQSCIFNPALNGSIPELYPDLYVTRANAILKVITTAAILGGVSISGLILVIESAGWGKIPGGRLFVALIIVIISTLGAIVSFWVPRRPAASPNLKFPWSGPLDTLKECAIIDKDRLLSLIVITKVFIWFVGSLLLPVINLLATIQLGLGLDMASFMVAAEVIGVAAGGIAGSRFSVKPGWHVILPRAILSMGLMLLLMAALPVLPGRLLIPAVFILLFVVGCMGGMVIVPCQGFVQIRPKKDRKGKVLASVNFAIFFGILVSGPVANVMNQLFIPTDGLAVVGFCSLPFGIWLRSALAKESAND